MRLALAVVLVLAVAGTASATEYLWFELIGGNAAVYNQGPGQILELGGFGGCATATVGVFMTDDGEGLRGFGFDLYTDSAIEGANPDAGLVQEWTSVSAEVSAAGPGTIIELGAFTAGAYPTLGVETADATMIASFDLILNGPGVVRGRFNTEVTHGTSAHRWGAYYNEAYVAATHLPAGQAYSGIGHYAGYDFGPVIMTIPEPAVAALFGLGIVAILRRR